MSGQPILDLAYELQGQMLDATDNNKRLNVQLFYVRSLSECLASRFITDADSLNKLTTSIQCRIYQM